MTDERAAEVAEPVEWPVEVADGHWHTSDGYRFSAAAEEKARAHQHRVDAAESGEED